MTSQVLLLVLALIAINPAHAERKEHSRFPLNEEERIVQYVDENQERPFCWLAIQKGDEEPVVFWSREAGDSIYWIGHPGGIAAADRSGDDVLVVLSSEKLTMYFIQANLKTKEERLTAVMRGMFENAFEFVSGGEFKVEAPNRIRGSYRYNGAGKKTHLLEWREDGKPYLDGEPFAHVVSPRVLPGTGKGQGTARLPIPPEGAAEPILRLQGKSAAAHSGESDASGWLLATAAMAVLGGALLFWRMKSRS